MSNTKVSSEQIIDDVALGGNPTTTTQSAGNNTTRVATTAFVTTAVSNLVDSAPDSLNTLNELAAAMNDNASFFSTVLPLSGGTMTGNLGIGASASSVIGVLVSRSLANGLAAELSNTESSTGSGIVVKGGNNSSTYSADFRDYNNTTLMRIRGDGNVGIGTSSPSEKLSISPDTDVSAEIGKAHIGSVGHSDYAGFAHVDKNTTSDYALLQGAAGDTFLNASDGQRIKFRINNSEKATIDSSGNLGIGTSSPSQTLHVNGNAFVSGQTFLGDASGDTVTLTGSLAHAGDFTIDVGGDITLDADGGDIKLSNGGTQFANFGDATGAVHIDAVISDDDIKFRGNDGGSTITALLLDMSASGAATFNAGGTFGGVLAVNSGTTNTVATFTSTDAGAGFNLTDDSGTSTIQTNGANLRIGVDEDAAVSSSAIQFRVDGSTKATINSSGYLLVGKTDTSFTTNGTEIRGGNLGARIIRQNAEPLTLHRQSSDGEVINLFVDSTQIGSLGTSSSDLVLTSSVSDKDILFKGNDGGSTITALTLDMSASGAATFNDQITLGGNLVHTGNFTIDSGGDITLDADGADIKLSDGGTEFGRFTRMVMTLN